MYYIIKIVWRFSDATISDHTISGYKVYRTNVGHFLLCNDKDRGFCVEFHTQCYHMKRIMGINLSRSEANSALCKIIEYQKGYVRDYNKQYMNYGRKVSADVTLLKACRTIDEVRKLRKEVYGWMP